MEHNLLIPSRDLLPDVRQKIKKSTQDAMVHAAIRCGLASAVDKLMLRDLWPDDLGLSTWNTWVTPWIQHRPQRMVIGLYKILQLSPNPTVNSIKFSLENVVISFFDLNNCYATLPIMDNLKSLLLDKEAREVLARLCDKDIGADKLFDSMEGYFTNPIIYRPEELITVQVDPPDQVNRIVLGGYVCKPIERRLV